MQMMPVYQGRVKFSIHCLMINQIITPFYYNACTFVHSKKTVTCVPLDTLGKRPLMNSRDGRYQQQEEEILRSTGVSQARNPGVTPSDRFRKSVWTFSKI